MRTLPRAGGLHCQSMSKTRHNHTYRRRRANRDHKAYSQPLTEPVSIVTLPTGTKIPPEIFDIVIDHLHNDLDALKVCSLVCKSWLPSSRYHLFRSLVVKPSRAKLFGQVLRPQLSTLPNHVFHLTIGQLGDSYFTPQRNLIRLIPRLSSMQSLKIHRVNHASFGEWSTLRFEAVIDLDIVFVKLKTFSELLDLLAAFPSLQMLFLSEISWSSSGLVPPPRSFPNLRVLNVHCTGTDDILDWLSKGALPSLTAFSVRTRCFSGTKFFQAVGMSLHHLKMKMADDRLYEAAEAAEGALSLCIDYGKVSIELDQSHLCHGVLSTWLTLRVYDQSPSKVFIFDLDHWTLAFHIYLICYLVHPSSSRSRCTSFHGVPLRVQSTPCYGLSLRESSNSPKI
jgi:hypothetical protein